MIFDRVSLNGEMRMTMVETIISALVVAAISGITFLAYRHPKSYPTIYIALLVTSFFVLTFVFSWNMSNSNSRSAISAVLLQSDENEKPIDSVTRLENLSLESDLRDVLNREKFQDWVWIVIIGFMAYIGLLKSLPLLIGEDDDDQEKQPKDD